MARRTVLAWGLALVALGCRSTGADFVPVVDPPQPRQLQQRDVTKILAELSTARGLPIRRQVRVTFVDPEEVGRIRNARANKAREERGDTGNAVEDFVLVGLDLVAPPGKGAASPSIDEVREEQVAAFYDLGEDEVIAPRTVPATMREERNARALLAHELHHALQTQSFPSLLEQRPFDASVARRALIEGDAMVASAAYLAFVNDVPVHRSIFLLRDALELPPAADKSDVRSESKLDRSPALVRELLTFPYSKGSTFAADLFRAGGFPLLNRAYLDPPSTTEHILHPEKYLAGELPRSIAEPAAPAGWTAVGSMTLGELVTKVWLERCAKDRAVGATSGWDGDRAVVFTRGDAFAFGWVTAWDSERDAEEFEAAARAMGPCFAENALDGKRIGARVSVQRSGDVVVLVRADGEEAQKPVSASLTGLVGKRPAARPISSAVIAPWQPIPRPDAGRFRGTSWSNEWLGISAPTSQDLETEATGDADGVFVEVKTHDGRASGSIQLSRRPTSPARLVEKTLGDYEQMLAGLAAKHDMLIQREGDDVVQTSLGSAFRRKVRARKRPLKVEVMVVPICGGAGSLVLMKTLTRGADGHEVDRWFESLRSTSPGTRAPVCQFLDPK